MSTEPREQINRYLPLTPKRAELFVEEWESFVLSCIHRMRILDSEDILYRVFYNALNALPNFRGGSKISTWLYKISWRECRRYIRKQNQWVRREAPVPDFQEQPDPDENILEALEREETAENVQRALAKLSIIDREVLALRYLEEMKIEELAGQLDIPVGTAKARIHRALGRLKILLEKSNDT